MTKLLEVKDLHVHYGVSHIIQGVSFSLKRGDGLAIFGRNGVGKSTLLHALMGFVRPSSGSAQLFGQELVGMPTFKIARSGLAIVPQGRRLFPTLSVRENLTLGETKGEWTLKRVFEMLPRLSERQDQSVGLMSGGEQQMVAIGRALLRNPELLLLDEPSEGLAPQLIDELALILAKLRERGMTILIVEQNLQLGVSITDRVLILDLGKIVYQSTTQEFRRDRVSAHQYLGVT